MSIPNVWHHRKVAESAAKGCDVCHKPTSSVLVTPDKADFFYACPGHLKDSKFCKPVVDAAAAEARKQKEKDAEIVAQARREYEEKQRKKKEKEEKDGKEKKPDGKDDAKDKEKDPKAEDDDKKKDEPAAEAKAKEGTPVTPDPQDGDEPRVFELQRNFYQMRLSRKRQLEEKKRQAEMSQRNRERLSNPSFFPSVPKGQP